MDTRRIVTNAVMVAVFAVLCLVGMEFLAINIGQPVPFLHGYRVQAVFSDADGIPTAADVRVAGIVVGKVTNIAHDPNYPGETVVTMDISDSRANPIYSNGFAKVRPKTLLGEKYIDLSIGNQQGEAIADNGMLPESQATKDVSNDEIFNAFDATTRDQQKQVLADLDAATQQRAGDIQAILPQVDTVIRDLDPVAQVYAKDDPSVRDIFQNLDTLLRTLADEHQQLAGLLSNGNVALGAIAQRDQSLIGTLQEASNVTQEFNAAAAPTVQAQRDALTRFAPALSRTNDLVGSILDPTPACNGPCHIDEVFTGTLLGQINYPNDQLTVTTSKANINDGEAVGAVWDSMFSFPNDHYHKQTSTDHAALNIQLSFHCDTIETTLGTFPLPSQLQDLVKQACPTITGQSTASTQSAPAGPSGATDAVDYPGAQP
jgi:virulence factor Mce-like protein